MKQIYRTIIRGRVLESDSLRQLLARAVAEKRAADLREKAISTLQGKVPSGQKPPVVPLLPVLDREETEP